MGAIFTLLIPLIVLVVLTVRSAIQERGVWKYVMAIPLLLCLVAHVWYLEQVFRPGALDYSAWPLGLPMLSVPALVLYLVALIVARITQRRRLS